MTMIRLLLSSLSQLDLGVVGAGEGSDRFGDGGMVGFWVGLRQSMSALMSDPDLYLQCHTVKFFHSKNIGFGTIFLHYRHFLRTYKNHDSKLHNILGIQHENQMRGQEAA